MKRVIRKILAEAKNFFTEAFREMNFLLTVRTEEYSRKFFPYGEVKLFFDKGKGFFLGEGSGSAAEEERITFGIKFQKEFMGDKLSVFSISKRHRHTVISKKSHIQNPFFLLWKSSKSSSLSFKS